MGCESTIINPIIFILNFQSDKLHITVLVINVLIKLMMLESNFEYNISQIL